MICVALIVGLAGACDPDPPGFCPDIAGLDKWVWTGAAGDDIVDGTKWQHAGNDGDGFPGGRNDPADADDHVCIPGERTLTIRDGQSVHVQVLDSAGILRVTPGGKVEVKGDPSTRQSFVKHVTLEGELFGRGKVTVRQGGTLRWLHAPQSTGAATMSTRESNAIGPGSPAIPGRTVIAAGARLVVDGLGVNLYDGRIIDNLGTTELTGAGAYIAADRGTTFRNTGRFDFGGDGDYAQGFARGLSTLGRFINIGNLRKVTGTGVSVVDAAYTRTEGNAGPGTITVSSGTLSVLSSNTVASVAPTASQAPTFATGGCSGTQSSCTDAATTPAEPQFTALTLPAGTASSTVTITEIAADGSKGRPVQLIVPSETATAAAPMTLELAVDATQLQPTDTHLTIDVTHNGVPVPDCTVPASGQASCVDRVGGSTVAGDVVMVVRTAQNGRWRLR